MFVIPCFYTSFRALFVQYKLTNYEGIHKGCSHLGGGGRLAAMRTKVEKGEGSGLAVSGHPLQCSL